MSYPDTTLQTFSSQTFAGTTSSICKMHREDRKVGGTVALVTLIDVFIIIFIHFVYFHAYFLCLKVLIFHFL